MQESARPPGRLSRSDRPGLPADARPARDQAGRAVSPRRRGGRGLRCREGFLGRGGRDMAPAIDPARARPSKTVAEQKVGFLCAALDTANQRLFAGATDFTVHAYDLPAVQPAKGGPLKGHGSYVTALAYLPRARVLISGSFD